MTTSSNSRNIARILDGVALSLDAIKSDLTLVHELLHRDAVEEEKTSDVKNESISDILQVNRQERLEQFYDEGMEAPIENDGYV